MICFFFQAEDGIRDGTVTGVQTCALPIYKQAYRLKMREVLESQPNLKIKQAEVADLITGQVSGVEFQVAGQPQDDGSRSKPETRNRVLGIKLRDGRTVGAQAVIITTGTFLNGLIHCGEQQYPAGRSGEPN